MIKKYSSQIWLAIIALAIIIIYSIIPKTYVWSPTYDHEDNQPFGCSLFDSIMARSMTGGYEVVDSGMPKLDPKTSAIIYTKDRIGGNRNGGGYYTIDSTLLEIETELAENLMNFVKRGGVLILATGEIADYGYYKVHRTYGLENCGVTYSSPHEYNEFNSFMEECRKYKHTPYTAIWEEDDSTYSIQPFMLYFHKMADYYNPHHYKPLVSFYNNYERTTYTVAYSKHFGKGLVEYVSVPLFFTNYGITDTNASKITERLLRPVAGRHVARIMGEVKIIETQQTENTGEFSYLISHPALKWALYLSMAVLCIFCLFTMRRRMRAIPLPPDQTNSTLEFAKYMGTYYFALGKHTRPVIAKYKSLIEDITDYYGWDVEKMSNQELADGIAIKTGEQPEKILHLIRAMNTMSHGHGIDQKSMMDLIDYITFLKKKL